ncbi:MAG: HEAT repeat protein [Candidatus Binatia bacterium]|jgi:HEAT repeat protein
MRRSREIGFVVLGIIFFALILAILPSDEPVNEGNTLTEWVDQIYTTYDGGDTNTPAALAIRQMGTNALPHLMRLVQPQTSPVTFDVRQHPFDVRQHQAAIAFYYLGSIAEPAILDLSLMLTNSSGGCPAGKALGGIGPKSFDTLTTALTSTNLIVQQQAVAGLGVMRIRGNSHIPILLAKTKIPQLRQAAIAALGDARQAPDRTLSTLIDALNDTNLNVRLLSAVSLGEYGARAKSATPALLRLMSSRNKAMEARFARSAIEKIDPAARAEFDESSN